MSNSDYKKRHTDLSSFIPDNLKNVFNEGFLKNLHNKFLTKDEAEVLLGFVGDKNRGDDKDPYIGQPNLDRELNALSPVVYTQYNDDEYVFSFEDILHKAEVLGVDVRDFAQWGAARGFNLHFPINIDRFCNFSKYRWYGHLIPHVSSISGEGVSSGLNTSTGEYVRSEASNEWLVQHNLGYNPIIKVYSPNANGDFVEVIPDRIDYSDDQYSLTIGFTTERTGVARILDESGFFITPIVRPEYNKDMDPEYVFTASTGVLADKNDYNRFNFWVHEDDVAGLGFDINDTIQALNPIIEFDIDVELNSHFKDGVPVAPGTPGAIEYMQRKIRRNQPPLFNLYNHDGTFADKVSTILAFAQSNVNVVDDDLNIRVKADKFGDYTMEQGLVDDHTGQLYFYKKAGDIQHVWHERSEVDVPRYVTKDSEGDVVDMDPYDDVHEQGSWIVPSQMFHNITHENRKQINYADLFAHLTNVIQSQDGFVGNPYGKNNFRELTNVDYGLGGKIRDYNTNFGTFLGQMNQLDSSIPGMIQFACQQYALLLSSVREHFTQNLGEILTTGRLKPSYEYGFVNDDLREMYADFISGNLKLRNQAEVFNDTTAGVPSFPATLPYLGMAELEKPGFVFNKATGLFNLVHHDGHKTKLTPHDNDLLKSLANVEHLRSDGRKTAGLIGANPPALPYKNYFWFNTNSNELLMYGVIADRAVDRGEQQVGDYWFERGQDKLYVWNGEGWEDEPNKARPWVLVRPEVIIDEITLMIENDLHDGVVDSTMKFDVDAYQSSNVSRFNELYENEFYVYANKQNVNPALSDFEATNAFTWNYSVVTIDGLSRPFARWHQMYEAYFGTARPDQEPWFLQGYTAKPSWWDATYPLDDNKWPIQMWLDISNDTVPGYPSPQGPWAKKLGVDVTTGALLPPYVNPSDSRSDEALLTAIPQKINSEYQYGDLGPVELAWRESIDFKYGVAKTAFRIDPINFFNDVWGHNLIATDNGYTIDRAYGKKLSHKDVVLHGEANTRAYDGKMADVQINPTSPQIWNVTCIEQSAQGSVFKVVGSVDGRIANYIADGTTYQSASVQFVIDDDSRDFTMGDVFTISATGQVTFTKSSIVMMNGINQWFVNLSRFNNVDMPIALSNKIFREWDIKMAYRVSGLINTENLKVRSDSFSIHGNDMNVMIKHNRHINDSWLNAIRVQLIRKGSQSTLDTGMVIPNNRGDDWVYRIEVLNDIHPVIEYYEVDTHERPTTFRALNGEATKDEWHKYPTTNVLKSVQMPLEITGIQNVVNFLFGYAMKLHDDGWRFSFGNERNVDEATGRTINWQFEIERFINQQYVGFNAGTGYILNPFTNKVWFETPFGMVSDFKNPVYVDTTVIPMVFNVLGEFLDIEQDVRIYRGDQLTEIHTDETMMGMHLFVDSYEHVILFEDYVGSQERQTLVYDPFLGVRVKRLHLTTEKQDDFNGRLTFGGHYIHDKQVRKNVESNIDTVKNMYDTTKMVEGSHAANVARGSVGYTPKEYMEALSLPDRSQFGFWQGMIRNKGSNLSIDAFLNSSRFESVNLDEFWAYKVAEFGDSRPKTYPELRLTTEENKQRFLKLQFLDGEQEHELGFTGITAFDEDRWFTLDDIGTEMHFTAELVAELAIRGNQIGVLHDIEQGGRPLFVDHVEVIDQRDGLDDLYLIDKDSVQQVDTFPATPTVGGIVYLPVNNTEGLVEGVYKYTGAAWDVQPAFELVNSSSIRFLTNSVNGAYFIVKCYVPSQPKFNPAKLIDYKNRVVVEDVALWDPARGSHVTEGFSIVDITNTNDPAQYNYSVRTTNNENYTPLKPWGLKEVGQVWWNTTNLKYIPYSDKKRFADVDERLSLWGSLTDYGSVDIHEWTESPVHPSEWAKLVKSQEGDADVSAQDKASGVVSNRELYARTRSWKQRAIAWKRTDAPGIRAHDFDVNSTIPMIITTPVVGPAKAILGTGTWSSLNVSDGQHISATDGSVVTGDAVIVGNEGFVVGANAAISGYIMADGPVTVPGFATDVEHYTDFVVEVTDADVAKAGPLLFTTETIDDGYDIKHYVRVTNTITNDSEALEVVDSPYASGVKVTLEFRDMGVSVSAVTAFSHTDVGYDVYENRILAIANSFGNSGHDVYIRSSVDVNVKIPFTENILVTDIGSDGMETVAWSAWTEPTDISSDLAAPNNIWEPLYGEYIDVDTSQTSYDFIKDYIDSPLDTLTGEPIIKYVYEYGAWELVVDETISAKYDGTGDSFYINNMAMESDVDISNVNVYVNGIYQRPDRFEVHPNNSRVIRLKTDPRLGDELYVINKKYLPSDDELEFDPEKSENPANLKQYKYDWQYTKREIRNSAGEVERIQYYFWVRDKSIVKPGRDISLESATQVIRSNPHPYGVLQNVKEADGKPVRYTQFVAVGLNRYVTKDDTYKLRFTKDFILRDDPQDINLKNVHTEWVLFRENQKNRVPEPLWLKLMDSAIGQDVAGNPLPSIERIEYDKRHNTRVKYGFGGDQVFVDKDLALTSIVHAILNISAGSTSSVSGVSVSNDMTFLDFSDPSMWFVNPDATRKTLTDIWNLARPEQVNYIFFTVFYDALAENYEFTDIIKTSMVAAHSIRLFNNTF